jgi:hypothetical protein
MPLGIQVDASANRALSDVPQVGSSNWQISRVKSLSPNFVVADPTRCTAVIAAQRNLNRPVRGFDHHETEVVAMTKWVHVPTPGSNGLLTCAG